MAQGTPKMIIIGGGIAGLCAGVYARKCGYRVEVVEMNETAGGLATSWHRGDYTFETCLHWLLGSNPNSPMYGQWQDVFDIGKLTFVNPQEYIRVETERGESLTVYANVDRMEQELLSRAPQDAVEIRHFASAIRRLAKLPMPDPTEPWLTLLHTVTAWPLLRQLSDISIEQYGQRFKHPLLRAFFGGGGQAKLSALALLFSLAWMSEQNAGYPLGGSQAIIRLIVDNFRSLGGDLRFGVKVAQILVEGSAEGDAAVGVELANGETIAADWVISAADGDATIYDLLGGTYTDKTIDEIDRTYETFPSYLQVSLGVAHDLSQRPGFVSHLLDAPLEIDPGTQLSQVSFRFFHFDPTFATPGKTPVTCFLPTRNFEYWAGLQQSDPQRYQAEKHRVAGAVIEILEQRSRRPPGHRSHRRVDPSHGYPLHRQLERKHGGLALDARKRIQIVASRPTRLAELPDGRPMSDARWWSAVGPVDRTIRHSNGMQARPCAIRRTCEGRATDSPRITERLDHTFRDGRLRQAEGTSIR